MFGVNERWRYDGVYHLQQTNADASVDTDVEIISKAVIDEVFKQEIVLHPSNARWTKVRQTLVLKGRTP